MTDAQFQPTFLSSPIPMAYCTVFVSNRTGREDEVRVLNLAAVSDMLSKLGLTA